MAKSHGIRKKGEHKIYFIKCECDSCNQSETLGCYEDQLKSRKFNLDFKECPNCFKIFCTDCETGSCPKCSIKLRELTPLEIHRCNKCFQDVKKSLCVPCKYPHLKKR